MPHRVGVVGCGGAGLLLHLPAIASLPERLALVATCDAEEARAHLAAQRFGAARSFTRADEMLRAETLDLVAVLTPHHEALVEAALLAGHHVFTEKPLSLRVEVSRRLVALARDRRRILEVGLMRRFDPALKEMLRAVPPDSVVSAVLTKIDGSDEPTRRTLLPAGLDAYTFGRTPPPNLPADLSGPQLDVLRTLLYSGVHLLSVAQTGFGPLKTIGVSRAGAAGVQCLLKGAQGQRLALAIADVDVPVFHEEVRVSAPAATARLRFNSPYAQPCGTELLVDVPEGDSLNSLRRLFTESPFTRMWSAVADQLDGRGMGDGCARAMLEIEATALECARMA